MEPKVNVEVTQGVVSESTMNYINFMNSYLNHYNFVRFLVHCSLLAWLSQLLKFLLLYRIALIVSKGYIMPNKLLVKSKLHFLWLWFIVLSTVLVLSYFIYFICLFFFNASWIFYRNDKIGRIAAGWLGFFFYRFLFDNWVFERF